MRARSLAVVAMLARHGKVAFVDVAGVQDVESGTPMTADSIFRIYSMTKPVTGVALMMTIVRISAFPSGPAPPGRPSNRADYRLAGRITDWPTGRPY